MRSSPLFGLFFLGLVACGSSSSKSDDNAATGDPANQTGTKILLDCNVFESGGGPDQQVTVIQREDGLVLRELTNSGSTEERPLSEDEWASKSLTLRRDRFDGPDAVNRLWKEGRDWMNESKGGGFSEYGSADCFTDRSK
jgi:hypothetical protein